MRTLGLDALVTAERVYCLIGQINAGAVAGDQAKAIKRLGQLAAILEPELPVIRGVITAQVQAAEALNLTHHTLRPFFPRPSGEEPRASNDEHGAALPHEHPAPDVAHAAPMHTPKD